MIRNPKYLYGPSDRTVPASLHFGEFIINRLHEFKGNPALINGINDDKLTYDDILQESMNFAVSLRGLGVHKGDVVAVSSENRREFWGSVVGIICTGATVTTINLGYTKDELKHVINITKPKVIICSPLAYKLHEKIYKSLPYLKHIIIFGGERLNNAILYNDMATLLDDGKRGKFALVNNVNYDDFVPVEVEGQSDVAFVLYSSGTTGLPKGVLLTHLNFTSLCGASTDMPPMLSLTITPWFHAFGLVTTLIGFSRGRTVIYLPRFEVDLYLSTIEKYKVTQISVVPAILVALSKSAHKYDTSSLVMAYSGAAPLYQETAQAFKTAFPSVVTVLQAYGMTETTLTVTLNLNTEKIGSVGCVVSNTVVKIVDIDTREPLGANKEGEICMKGSSIMKGYIGRARKEDFDDEGFFRSGDVGYYDDDGYIYIVDRLKELIKYKGYQVAPAEIEALLLRHEGVKDAGVVGIPHPSAGEVPLAFVVTQDNVTITAKDLQNYVAEKLSNPKRLRGGVRFVKEIPKNQTGKILRKELRKMAEAKKSKL